jgi:hypothetical protein
VVVRVWVAVWVGGVPVTVATCVAVAAAVPCGVPVNVGSGVEVTVTVADAVPCGVLVKVGSGVEVAVTVADAVPCGVLVNVGSGVDVDVARVVAVAVGGIVAVLICVGETVCVTVGCPGRVAVRVTVGATASVAVAVASAVGSGVCVFTACVGVGLSPDESSSFPQAAKPPAIKLANARRDSALRIGPRAVVLIILPSPELRRAFDAPTRTTYSVSPLTRSNTKYQLRACRSRLPARSGLRLGAVYRSGYDCRGPACRSLGGCDACRMSCGGTFESRPNPPIAECPTRAQPTPTTCHRLGDRRGD